MLSGSEMAVATSLDSAKLERLEINRIGARKEMLDRKTRLEAIEKLQGDELLYSAALLVGDAALTALRQELIQAEAKLKQLQETLGAKHPDVVQLTSVVDDLKKKIGDALQGIKLGLQTDYAIALKAYEEADADLVKAREDDIKLHGEAYLPFRKQESLLARQRELRNALENRLMQERLDLDQPRRPVEVVDPAEAPAADEPVSPKMALNIVLSVIVGLGCGIGLVFFVEYMDTSVKTVEDIERYIGASIMGVIPQKVRPLLDEGADSAHAESYRVLRMNVQFSKKLGNGNTLCVTSGGAGEGKSLTLFNLAYVSAQLGDRVLLVDSDMRRPTQHKMFKAPNRLGLADLLVGKASVDEVIKTSSVPNLDFLPSGKLPSSAHGVLSAARLRALIDELKTRYDYVFFDAPPIMGVSDAAIISSEVDGVLLVVQHRSYPRAVSLRAKNMVDNVGGNLIGVVLNNINVTRDYYYYYYHSYYYTYRDKESRAERKGAAAKAAAEPAAPVPPQKA
jgi:capsular exopolysaccharide synthesis family protein